MHAEVVIAGSGGQGVLLIGRLLAEAGVLEEHEVVWLPSYGAEKRGGTVSCSVIVSDENAGAMFITRPTAAIAMNLASMEKFEMNLQSRGLLVVNQSLVSSRARRDDIRLAAVPANEMAAELGDASAGNMVLLGALLAAEPIVSRESILAAMYTAFARNPKHLEMNRAALLKGYAFDSAASASHVPYGDHQSIPAPGV